MYSGDHRKGLGLLATIFVLLVPIQQLFVLLVPIQQPFPQPAVTGYYWPPGHETFTFRPFTEETHRTHRESATFRLALFTTFFTTHHSIFKSVCRTPGDVAVRADLGAGSPWADFVRHHVVVGVQRKHALVPRWPSN
jgi:hypothetical protein